MFTGITGGTGLILKNCKRGSGRELTVRFPRLVPAKKGDSIALDGVCLTLEKKSARKGVFYLGSETLAKSSLGKLEKEDRVNFETSLKLGASLGGHLVLGHVDTILRVAAVEPGREEMIIKLRLPAKNRPLVVPRAFIAINGVSLTVARVGKTTISLMLIPETLKRTNLRALRRGSHVNVEFDIIGKYIQSQARRRH